MAFTTDYLIVLDKKTVGLYYNLINQREMFIKLLKNEANIEVQNNKITYNKEVFDFRVRHGVVAGKEQRYFYLSISTKDDNLVSYSKLLREIKQVLGQHFIVETLQDDVSFHYSNRAYSMIHEIENLMRKFITFFMITNVGKDWVSDTTPDHVKVAMDKSKQRNYASELQKLDFKDLGYFLFDEYQKSEVSSLLKKIDTYKNVSEIKLNDLKSYVPKSNWDIYFKKHVEFEGSALAKRWEKLYELRNSVAHTTSINKVQYEEIKDLVEEVRPVLQKAFETLGKLKLDTSDRLAISQNVVTKLDSEVADYFKKFKEIEEEIRSLAPDQQSKPIDKLLDYLKEEGAIASATHAKILKLIELKESVSFDTIPSSESIDNLGNRIGEIQDTIQNTWSKEVYYALEELGGKSKWDNIYNKVEEKTRRKLYGSWKTSVRRAIYTNSSDVELFNGKYDIYRQVAKGVWMIRKNIEPRVLKEFLGAGNG